MIESAILEKHAGYAKTGNANDQVLRMKPHDRMGGSVPVWEKRDSAKTDIAGNIEKAAQKPEQNSFEQALSYAESGSSQKTQRAPEPFGFGDLFDMVNPLQHIPLVNLVYREITGDDIRPASKIIGGAAFGGFGGAATALADTIIEYETGKSISGNILHVVSAGQAPEFKNRGDHPEAVLENAAKTAGAAAPASNAAIAFADLGYREEAAKRHYAPVASGRTAGTMPGAHKNIPDTEIQRTREPITEFSLSSMPPQARYND